MFFLKLVDKVLILFFEFELILILTLSVFLERLIDDQTLIQLLNKFLYLHILQFKVRSVLLLLQHDLLLESLNCLILQLQSLAQISDLHLGLVQELSSKFRQVRVILAVLLQEFHVLFSVIELVLKTHHYFLSLQ